LTDIFIPRIADIPIYIADSAVWFNGDPHLVGGNVLVRPRKLIHFLRGLD
jgi:hypothetical protein